MPSPYTHIVCCVERSSSCMQVVEEARRLRALGPGRLTFIHVCETTVSRAATPEVAPLLVDQIDDSSHWLAELAGEDEQVMMINHEYPPRAVCEWASSEESVDLLVAGAERSHLERFFRGAFATYLAYHAPCPVLLVRPQAGD